MHRPVHPHACGENHIKVGATAAATGTSPRVWGKRLQRLRHQPPTRYIPTRVGKTSQDPDAGALATGTSPRVWGKHQIRCCAFVHRPVHPHACGENEIALVRHCRHPRYIPTRVGKTAIIQPVDVLIAVHPHACGENGSSGVPVSRPLRYIPTRVGKTSKSPSPWGTYPVHPHACGENSADSP